MGVREITIGLRSGLHERDCKGQKSVHGFSRTIRIRTVDDENHGRSIRKTRDTKEMDVILGQSHSRLIVASIPGNCLNVIPWYLSRVRSLHQLHIERKDVSFGIGI
jgi:hypothetical protein